MQKILFILFICISILTNVLIAKAETTITIGASAVPHAEILEFIKPILAKKSINLKIIIFKDYIMPNRALADREIDANYYQHIAFLYKQEKEFGYKFTNLGNIHIEPMGVYSKRFKTIQDIKDGTTVLLSNSISDRGRMLLILQSMHLIKLRKFKNKFEAASANFNDIISNKKHLVFKSDIDPSMLPSAYLNDSAGLVFINTNFAIAAGINPQKDSLFLENGKSSLYTNILVSREDNAKNPALLELVKVLHSKAVKDFIIQKYNGAIIPVN